MQQIRDDEYNEPYSDFDTIWEYVKHYRWLVNFWILGVPYFFFAAATNDWNLYFNIEFNYYWAGGNVFLLWNTVFGFFQSFLSVMMVLSLPTWLREAKTIRMWSF
jgi:hypothetical protein